MKKLVLLLAAGAMVLTAGAQERRTSVVYKQDATAHAGIHQTNTDFFAKHSKLVNARTTTPGGGRWYDYVDSILGDVDENLSTVIGLGATEITVWNDTTAVVGYDNGGSPAYYINNWTSVGLSLDPYAAAFNDSTYFPHEIKVGSTNAYTIDSVEIVGSYTRPANAGTYVDTLRLGFVYGDGSSTSDLPGYYFGDAGVTSNFPYVPYGVDTLNFIDMLHDSLNNQAGVTSAPGSLYTINIPLHAADTATAFDRKFAVTFNVAAANYASISIGFRSGTTVPQFDTVSFWDGTAKYGNFSPLIAYCDDGTSSATPEWAPYNKNDQNVGYFKREGAFDGGWGGNYIPTWAWSTSTGASALQYPVVNFHVTCSTCGLTSLWPTTGGVHNVANIGGVKAYPNPANNQLNVVFTLANSSDVTVTLTNVLGQTVATQTLANVTNGVAKFNTATMPAGMYVYTINANGERTTGHVVVAH